MHGFARRNQGDRPMDDATSGAFQELPWPRVRELVPGGVSFTAYLVYCLGRALDEHKALHAYRHGRKKLVVFDDVDVNTLLEKRKPDGSLVPVTYIVRAANRKSLAEVNHELRQASASDLHNDEGVRRRRKLMRLPRVVRAALWWRMLRDPARLKREMGTAGLSDVGSLIAARPSWGVASSFLTGRLLEGGAGLGDGFLAEATELSGAGHALAH
jgi:hypothetical protein